jgi:hypothetical protein
MEQATPVTIPTIVHLMLAEDSELPAHNKDVRDTEEAFPKLLEKSVNGIWRPAAVQFELDGFNTVGYRLKDFGAKPGVVDREEITFKCSHPPTKEEKQRVHDLQEKFGIRGFRGLQVFVLARIRGADGDVDMGGCAISELSDGTIGSAWLDAPGVMGGSRTLAHEIGHFLRLSHVPDPKRLMNGEVDGEGTDLVEDEIKIARRRAVELMKKQ